MTTMVMIMMMMMMSMSKSEAGFSPVKCMRIWLYYIVTVSFWEDQSVSGCFSETQNLCAIFEAFGSTSVSYGVLVMLVAKDIASLLPKTPRDVKMYTKSFEQKTGWKVSCLISPPFSTCFNRFFKEFVPTILNLDDDEELVFDLGMWGRQHHGNDGSMWHVSYISYAYL